MLFVVQSAQKVKLNFAFSNVYLLGLLTPFPRLRALALRHFGIAEWINHAINDFRFGLRAK